MFILRGGLIGSILGAAVLAIIAIPITGEIAATCHTALAPLEGMAAVLGAVIGLIGGMGIECLASSTKGSAETSTPIPLK